MRYALILTALSAILTFTGCQSAPANGNKTANLGRNGTAKPADDVKRISVQDAKAAVDAGKAVIVDVRPAAAWEKDRIKGSISLPGVDLKQKYADLPKDKDIIFSCSCPNEHSSATAVIVVRENGITNTSALLGGTEAWRSAGYPMDGEGIK